MKRSSDGKELQHRVEEASVPQIDEAIVIRDVVGRGRRRRVRHLRLAQMTRSDWPSKMRWSGRGRVAVTATAMDYFTT